MVKANNLECLLLAFEAHFAGLLDGLSWGKLWNTVDFCRDFSLILFVFYNFDTFPKSEK